MSDTKKAGRGAIQKSVRNQQQKTSRGRFPATSRARPVQSRGRKNPIADFGKPKGRAVAGKQAPKAFTPAQQKVAMAALKKQGFAVPAGAKMVFSAAPAKRAPAKRAPVRTNNSRPSNSRNTTRKTTPAKKSTTTKRRAPVKKLAGNTATERASARGKQIADAAKKRKGNAAAKKRGMTPRN
ncbi:hypothetical protein TL16_g04180 [Triparma laevis f. inornata]|uniref:Uncharacterized protein n=1 Tax=Triparma laevis f. inornata TaxID=1714386 RepID=A0A9W7E4Y5_9STRA|nr:hypothetical protein TL16_g04180 [Triparma laevis f. inornata]